MKPLRILFLLRSFVYLRNFESTIRLLAARGHRFTILVSPDERKITPEMRELSESLVSDLPDAIVFGQASGRGDRYRSYVAEIRAARDFLRYRTPYFANAPKLAARARSWASPLMQRLLDRRAFARTGINARLGAGLTALEAAVPPDPGIVAQMRANAPDLVLATPLVDLGSDQVDWIKAARALGIPSALAVASWDNLTNKGIIQVVPDRVIVWNDFQKTEAIELHGVAPEAIEVTGAQLYDQWFERRPSRDYASFCVELGLDPERRTILYVGSTIFIVRDETPFVRRWIEAVRREGGPAVRSANILIRPHPMHQVPFQSLDVGEFENCAIHPLRGGMPVNERARADYFDALHHCSAVVGINTSALVEASILGKRCFSVRDPEFALTQEGTVHFHYLVNGGLLRLADRFPEHLDQLEAELSASPGKASDLQGFVRAFIRPLGLEVKGTPRLVAAIEAVAAGGTSKVAATKRTMAQAAASPLLHVSALSRSRTLQNALDVPRSYRLLKKAAGWTARQGGRQALRAYRRAYKQAHAAARPRVRLRQFEAWWRSRRSGPDARTPVAALPASADPALDNKASRPCLGPEADVGSRPQ